MTRDAKGGRRVEMDFVVDGGQTPATIRFGGACWMCHSTRQINREWFLMERGSLFCSPDPSGLVRANARCPFHGDAVHKPRQNQGEVVGWRCPWSAQRGGVLARSFAWAGRRRDGGKGVG